MAVLTIGEVASRAAQLARLSQALAEWGNPRATAASVAEASQPRPVARKDRATGDDSAEQASTAPSIGAASSSLAFPATPQARNGAPQPVAATSEQWLRRQVEILSRMDENLRRLRELAESPSAAVFAEPAY